MRLFLRPEHTSLSVTPGAENSVPVTIGEVAFEGSFISVHAKTENGTELVAELRNDGSATVPAVGTKMHATFDAARAAILPNASTAGE